MAKSDAQRNEKLEVIWTMVESVSHVRICIGLTMAHK